jgi:succinate-semialdehyde dehydrogenase/glutarate-semialdehyde dehydrogenase
MSTDTPYPELSLCIDGHFLRGDGRDVDAVIDPATEAVLGQLPRATEADIDGALDAAQRGFELWRHMPAVERGRKLRRVAELIRARREAIAPLITRELGKPLREALLETDTAAEMFEWAAAECRRNYGRTIPARVPGMRLIAERVPVGPVAGFSGWNAPLITPSRKIAGALGAGCSIVMKPAETTPASALALMRCILDADIPPAVVGMLFGDPAQISQRLLHSPVIRLVTFTGSVPVGKQLAALAAQTMKRTIMELGGHAPCIVCDDADIDSIAHAAAAAKFRNAGQVCTSPTRFFVQHAVYERFVERFAEAANAFHVGNGLDAATTMGPLASRRRLDAIDALTQDAISHGAQLVAGGHRIGERGWFFAPTVLRDVPAGCRAMSEEPFGPLALIAPFDHCEEAIQRANALPLGLAGYACTFDTRRTALLRERLECGTLAFNHFTASWPETPFGGVKESGLGSEGGIEGLQAFQQVRFISEA